jgi:hypothetical protein
MSTEGFDQFGNTFKTLGGSTSCGNGGSISFRIQAAGSNLSPGVCQALSAFTYEMLEKLKDEMIALQYAASPEHTRERVLQREQLLGCFPQPIFVEEIPNGYCSRGCCRHLPWFIVTTTVGRFKIGWRKRVINIDWSDTRGTHDTKTLFAGEDVTKDARMIHAWSVEKARSYVATILTTASLPA